MRHFLVNSAVQISGGESLPVSCNPTSSRSERTQQNSAPKKPLPKVMNARHLSGGKRSKDTIDMHRSSVPQEIYRPSPGSMFILAVTYRPFALVGHMINLLLTQKQLALEKRFYQELKEHIKTRQPINFQPYISKVAEIRNSGNLKLLTFVQLYGFQG